MRRRMLEALARPGSAASLARELDLSRQRVNYHLRALEQLGLVQLVEERKKGNCTERIVRARSRSFLIAPQALGARGTRTEHIADRFSSAYLLAVASQLVRDVSTLRQRPRTPTLTFEADVAFATPAARAQFAAELAEQVSRLVARHHTDGGRPFRLVVAAHPKTDER